MFSISQFIVYKCKKKEEKKKGNKQETLSTGTFYKTVQNNTHKYLDDHSFDLPLTNVLVCMQII